MSFDLYQSVADLRSGWKTLHDVEKGRMTVSILAAGVSGRTLAKAVSCSEGTIRNLVLVVTKALPEEIEDARTGKLSTRALVRRIRHRHNAGHAQDEPQPPRDCEQDAQRLSGHVVTWIGEMLAPPYAKQVIAEARRKLTRAEATGHLPKDAAPKGMPVAEIISRCRPSPRPRDGNTIDWYARWLALWSFYSVPESKARLTGLELALTKLA